VAGGSDSPIETYSPFRGMFDAMFRVAADAEFDTTNPTDIFRPSERLSFDEALWLYTIGAAYAANCERVLGKIEIGFAADLVLVNPSALDDHSLLKDLEPDLVVVGGDVRFAHPSAGDKGVTVTSSSSTSLAPSSSLSSKRAKVETEADPRKAPPQSQRGPYVPGKNGSLRPPLVGPSRPIKGLPRAEGFCACWLKGRFCVAKGETLFCRPVDSGDEPSTHGA
jgi:hypothetical protein